MQLVSTDTIEIMESFTLVAFADTTALHMFDVMELNTQFSVFRVFMFTLLIIHRFMRNGSNNWPALFETLSYVFILLFL